MAVAVKVRKLILGGHFFSYLILLTYSSSNYLCSVRAFQTTPDCMGNLTITCGRIRTFTTGILLVLHFSNLDK